MIPELDINALPAVELSERHNLPDVVAVYFVLSPSGAMLYIGATASLHRRWYSTKHHRLWQLPLRARIAWLETEPSQLAHTESVWIERFQPKFNRMRASGSKAKARPNASTRLDQDVYDRIEKMAVAQGRTVSTVINMLLRKALWPGKKRANGK